MKALGRLAQVRQCRQRAANPCRGRPLRSIHRVWITDVNRHIVMPEVFRVAVIDSARPQNDPDYRAARMRKSGPPLDACDKLVKTYAADHPELLVGTGSHL